MNLSEVTVYRDRGDGLFGRYFSMVILRSSEMPQREQREYLEIFRGWIAKKRRECLEVIQNWVSKKIKQKKRLSETTLTQAQWEDNIESLPKILSCRATNSHDRYINNDRYDRFV